MIRNFVVTVFVTSIFFCSQCLAKHNKREDSTYKISMVDFSKLRKESRLGQSIDIQAKQMMDNFNKAMSDMEENLKKEQSDSNPKKPTSREEYSESMYKFEEKQDNYIKLSRQLRAYSRNSLQNAEQEFKNIVQKTISQYIDTYKLKRCIILEKSQVIFSKEIPDITNHILNLLDKSEEKIIIKSEVADVGL